MKERARTTNKPTKRRAKPARRPEPSEADDKAAIKDENRRPWEEVRWLVAGLERGDETFGVHYDEKYLDYPFYDEWRGRLGRERAVNKTRSGFDTRAAAVAAAEKALAERLASGWIRVSRQRLLALQASLKRR